MAQLMQSNGTPANPPDPVLADVLEEPEDEVESLSSE
jgi:hypothetical protein